VQQRLELQLVAHTAEIPQVVLAEAQVLRQEDAQVALVQADAVHSQSAQSLSTIRKFSLSAA
jgi:hypothetical protein